MHMRREEERRRRDVLRLDQPADRELLDETLLGLRFAHAKDRQAR